MVHLHKVNDSNTCHKFLSMYDAIQQDAKLRYWPISVSMPRGLHTIEHNLVVLLASLWLSYLWDVMGLKILRPFAC